MIFRELSFEEVVSKITFSLIILAPKFPRDICNNVPVLKIVFSSSSVLIYFVVVSFGSLAFKFGGIGILNGSSTKVMINPTIFVIGFTIIFSVSLTNDREVIDIIMHVKTVVEKEKIAESITACLVENLANDTK